MNHVERRLDRGSVALWCGIPSFARQSEQALDRTVLPIPEPKRPAYTELPPRHRRGADDPRCGEAARAEGRQRDGAGADRVPGGIDRRTRTPFPLHKPSPACTMNTPAGNRVPVVGDFTVRLSTKSKSSGL